jgi:hypothetical protein
LLDERFPDQFLTFDKYATFPLRYTRYRRYGESGNPRPYLGEFDLELHKRR